MSWHPNSNKHKATHGGYRKKVTKAQSKATFDFFDTSGMDFSKMNVVLASPGFGQPRLGTQLKMDL
jgi:hypothetical protein